MCTIPEMTYTVPGGTLTPQSLTPVQTHIAVNFRWLKGAYRAT